METHRAGELIDIILKEAPPLAIRGLAVVAESTAVFSNGDAQVQKSLVILGAQQLPTDHNLLARGSEQLLCGPPCHQILARKPQPIKSNPAQALFSPSPSAFKISIQKVD